MELSPAYFIRIRSFGQWITNFDWSDVFQISDCALKLDKFVDIMLPMVDCYFPSKLTKTCYSDKPWMTPSLKFAIRKRQIKSLYVKMESLHKLINFGVAKFNAVLKLLEPSIILIPSNLNPSRW